MRALLLHLVLVIPLIIFVEFGGGTHGLWSPEMGQFRVSVIRGGEPVIGGLSGSLVLLVVGILLMLILLLLQILQLLGFGSH